MGLITPQKVKIKWHQTNKRHYEKLGYVFTKWGDEFEVKVEDLPKGSIVKVQCICDGCGEVLPPWRYQSYNRSVKKDEKKRENEKIEKKEKKERPKKDNKEA